MAVQVRDEGRYLGGRPPYGYRLADAGRPEQGARGLGTAGPPPGARPGDRAYRPVDLRPAAGRVFGGADRAGAERGRVPCPSAADPGRNPHRTGTGWTLGTIATILPTRGTPAGKCGTGSGPTGTWPTRRMRASGTRACSGGTCPDGWVISNRPAHPALVSEADFVAAQDISAARGPVPHDEPVLRRYLLAGLLACGLCGGGWNQPGPTARPRTGAGMAGPARWRRTRVARRHLHPRGASCCRTCPPCTCCLPDRL